MTIGEWAAFGAAAITGLFGLIALAAPRLTFRLLRLAAAEGHPEAVSEGRATIAGFYLGVGMAAMLLAQPLVYMALGAGWLMTAVGRAISMILDRGFTIFNALSLLLELGLAALPLAYALGYLP